MNNYLLYLAHGDIAFKNEVLGSVLSYLNIHKDDNAETAKILICTDDSSYFKNILGEVGQIKYEEIGEVQRRAWRGEIDFIHRVKIEAIRYALMKYGGNIVYLDSDTYFIKNEAPIFEKIANGACFMHVQESVLKEAAPVLHRNLYAFLTQHPSAEWQHVTPHTMMYNAGTIGLSEGHVPLLTEVLHLTDTLYRVMPSHVVEQFAFSYCLSQVEPVQETYPYILHYWHMKDARPKLAEFFAQITTQPLPTIMAAFEQVPLVQASSQKDKWEAYPRWQRGIMRAIGMGWRWPEY